MALTTTYLRSHFPKSIGHSWSEVLPTLLLLLALSSLLPFVSATGLRVTGQAEEELRIIVPLEGSHGPYSSSLGRCTLVHELIDAWTLSCPMTVANELLERGLALEDKLYRPFDLESDAYINADDSWALGFRGLGVKVAVLDTGVDPSHPELADSILLAANFVRGPNRPEDENGHGTHVIGIVTANGGQTITGGADFNLANPNHATGSSPDAFILSGRVCGRTGCILSDIEKGIEWAVQQGARVINLSLGGGNYGTHCDGDRLAAKANWAVDQGVVVVAASGNDGAGVSSPACGSKVIATGAVYQRNIGRQDYSPVCIDETTAQDQIVCFSNTGPALDLVAPGAGILSTFSCLAAGDCSRAWYAWGWGTSQASPHVAAVAALVLSVNFSLTPGQVKSILERTARDLGPRGRDDVYGAGVVDALAAVREATGLRRPFEMDWADYDNSGRVTIFDLSPAGQVYGEANSYWDFNLNGFVDIFDISRAAALYAQSFGTDLYPGKGSPPGQMDPSWREKCELLPEPHRTYCITRI